MFQSHKDLPVWQKSMDLVCEIYSITSYFPKDESFCLTNQIRRAAISIPSNIAEGHGRSTSKEFSYFLNVSRGSLAEIDTQAEIAYRLNYINEQKLNDLKAKITGVDKMLFSLQKTLP